MMKKTITLFVLAVSFIVMLDVVCSEEDTAFYDEGLSDARVQSIGCWDCNNLNYESADEKNCDCDEDEKCKDIKVKSTAYQFDNGESYSCAFWATCDELASGTDYCERQEDPYVMEAYIDCYCCDEVVFEKIDCPDDYYCYDGACDNNWDDDDDLHDPDCDDLDPDRYHGNPEICDNKDNDCDGQIDEGVTQNCGVGLCFGTQTCNRGKWGRCSSKGSDCGTCAKCNSEGDCSIYDSTQDGDCPLCQKCSGLFTCANQARGSDIKQECSKDSCKYGYCDGAGSCAMKPTTTRCNNDYLCSNSGGGDNMYGAVNHRVPSRGFCDTHGNCDYSLSAPLCDLAKGTNQEGTSLTVCVDSQSSCVDTCSDSLDNDADGCTDSVDSDCGGLDDNCNGIDEDCDGVEDDDYNSVTCSDSECIGTTSCENGSVICSSWDTECSTKRCCQCNGGTESHPEENYDETQDSDCDVYDLVEIAACDNDPDNNLLTFDYAAGFDSVCSAIDTCTQSSYSYVHTCNMSECDAECITATDCDATDCDYLDGCYNGKYYDCDDVSNSCFEDCNCADNECPDYSTCSQTGTDADADGYDVECGDCNDNNPKIHPAATEVCNGIDDDCDEDVDESPDELCSDTVCPDDGCGVGGCESHIYGDYPNTVSNTCVDGACESNECTATCEEDGDDDGYSVGCGDCDDTNLNINPGMTEICNNVDDDCDQQIDGITEECGSDLGECKKGLKTCTNGMWGSCIGEVLPMDEVCNGKDDDCDGSVDENPDELCFDTDCTGFEDGCGAIGCTIFKWGTYPDKMTNLCINGQCEQKQCQASCVEHPDCPPQDFVPPPAIITINSPEPENYQDKKIMIDVEVDKVVERLSIGYDKYRPRFKCRDCDSYSYRGYFKNGPHNLTVYVECKDGKKIQKSVLFNIDYTKPRIYRTTPRCRSYSNGLFSVFYTEDNLKEATLFYGNKTNTSTHCPPGRRQWCEFDMDLGGYQGKLYYHFELEDMVGNKVKSRECEVKVDTTPPHITYFNVTNIGRYVYFNITLNEKAKYIKYIDNEDKSPRERTLCSRCDEYGALRVRKRSFRKGFHNLTISAMDEAGNRDTRSVSFIVDY